MDNVQKQMSTPTEITSVVSSSTKCILCSKTFKTQGALKQHTDDKHMASPIMCAFCDDETFKTLEALKQHTDDNHAACPICNNKLFKTLQALLHHSEDMHPTCPSCDRVFRAKYGKKPLSSHERLLAHQIEAGHCYCPEHEAAFHSIADFKAHKHTTPHSNISFECIDCDRTFGSQQALYQHLDDEAHTRPDLDIEQADAVKDAVEEANLHCISCDRRFVNLRALLQHKDSVKHKPLSELRCPLSSECERVFTSPSALLSHLESGQCRSGLDRDKLNDLIITNDIDRQISYASQVPIDPPKSGSADDEGDFEADVGQAPLGALDIVEVDQADNGYGSDSDSSESSGVLLTPTVSYAGSLSSSGGVLLTPSPSSGALSEWSNTNRSANFTPPSSSIAGASAVELMLYDTPNGLSCYICGKTFRKELHLRDHLNSPAHAPKIFHCPTALLGLSGSKAPLAFKTISGLAQHIEAGACAGGGEALKAITQIFEERIKAVTGKDVKLLRADANQ